MDRSQVISSKIGYQIWGWITAPPSLYIEGETLISIMQMLLKLVGSERVYIRSSEPCMYRTTAQGLAALADALRNRCIRFLEFDTDQFTPSGERYSPAAIPGAETVLQLPPYGATTIGITLGFSDRSEMLTNASELAEVIKASFISTAAVYGYVSAATLYITADGSIVHDTHARDLLPWTVRWPAVRRFTRGVFWGNALGEEICERLGGRERVLADAPAQIRHPLGSGVWLQLSPAPPASKTDVDKLARYLAPVLDWNEDDGRTTLPQDIIDPEPRGIVPWVPLLLSRAAAEPTIATIAKPLTIRTGQLEAESDDLLVINIHLAETPTATQRETIMTALVRWYRSVEDSDRGWGFFRDVRDLVINGTVIRWSAETHGLDLDDALRRLRIEFASVDNVGIVEIVIGTEMVG